METVTLPQQSLGPAPNGMRGCRQARTQADPEAEVTELCAFALTLGR